jgi:hypothetical protein
LNFFNYHPEINSAVQVLEFLLGLGRPSDICNLHKSIYLKSQLSQLQMTDKSVLRDLSTLRLEFLQIRNGLHIA